MAIRDTLKFQHHHTYADLQGQYLILTCTIAQATYTLVKVYGPNSRQLSFLRRFFNLKKGNLILGGDLVGDPSLDTSTKQQQHRPSLNPLLHDLGVFDVWRTQHGSERDYTYFSHPQLSYSCIDSFLVNKWTLKMSSTLTVSFHGRTMPHLHHSRGPTTRTTETLEAIDSSLLVDTKVLQEIEAEHQSFFDLQTA